MAGRNESFKGGDLNAAPKATILDFSESDALMEKIREHVKRKTEEERG